MRASAIEGNIESKANGGDRRYRVGNCLLPMSPSFLSSKSRKCFLLDISPKPLMVFSDQSSMISAWVFRTHIESPTSSATLNRSYVVWTSADTQRLERFMEMRLRRYVANGDVLGCSARVEKGRERMECFSEAIVLRVWEESVGNVCTIRTL